MGYTTDFEGRIEIEPALNAKEVAYLNDFAATRHMDREDGPYFVDGSYGHGPSSGVRDYNRPPASQPGLWCKWGPTEDGTALEWTGHEKFYDAAEWMQYLMDHFLAPTAIAKSKLSFLQGHVCNGAISAQGDDPSDMWLLVVKDNQVYVQDLVLTADGEPAPVATSAAKMIEAPAPKGISYMPDSDKS